MRKLLSILAICTLSAGSCSKINRFTVSKAQITEEQALYKGTICLERGADGPYARGPGVVGSAGGGLIFGAKDQSAECPGVPGYHYEGYSYINSEGMAYIVVRKIPEEVAPGRGE